LHSDFSALFQNLKIWRSGKIGTWSNLILDRILDEHCRILHEQCQILDERY
jgi:hypothetical protein